MRFVVEMEDSGPQDSIEYMRRAISHVLNTHLGRGITVTAMIPDELIESTETVGITNLYLVMAVPKSEYRKTRSLRFVRSLMDAKGLRGEMLEHMIIVPMHNATIFLADARPQLIDAYSRIMSGYDLELVEFMPV